MVGVESRHFHVLVTRPEPGASKTALRLNAIGMCSSVVPLTEIHPLPVPALSGSFDATIVTSANAVLSASCDTLANLRSLPAFAVGDATGDALRVAGFKNIVVHGPDAASLSAKLASFIHPSGRIAYLCGRERKTSVEEALSNFDLTVIETYHAPIRNAVNDELNSVVSAHDLTHVLCYSRRASAILAGISSIVSKSEIVFVCISEDVAEPLLSRGLSVRTAHRANEDAIFELLGGEERL